MIIVNLKAYSEAVGWKARDISRKAKAISQETGKRVVICPQPYDIRICEGEIYAQHLDAIEPGSHTGSLLPDGVKDAGASGTILNHSENRIERDKIKKTVEKCRDLSIKTVVCGQSPEECGDLDKLNPDFIAFEPPELIGGDISVSSAEPSLIEDAVERCESDVLAGAGIQTQEDVEKSIELGCKGVLVASGVVKAEKPGEKIMELCKGL